MIFKVHSFYDSTKSVYLYIQILPANFHAESKKKNSFGEKSYSIGSITINQNMVIHPLHEQINPFIIIQALVNFFDGTSD